MLSNYVFSENCKIDSIRKGELRDLLVATIKGKNLEMILDVISSLNVFNEGEEVRVILSREKPEFTEKDFCAHGYVVTEKKKGDNFVSIISFFGPLLRIVSADGFLQRVGLKSMDHVYFCVRKNE
ncbi:DNA-directed RNA polymerase subunit G [Metallosphaera hakonensis]|uniref:DNA-directed RNA polymerase subunit Rpo8 n=1 Tax=Metallosphaera hakonensis JCM 8857 = DSM 7519 TaxID=1293036 RepID=A0A2U9IXM0_9CREN|nr:DNA-directed RNA polymerase subunit G [Metallosphaera hakonensis]AWS00608.1 DNA-directed RNA polymerase subunit G [Metallosphaera hakonensis JCM 8857 = DSM 7519]